MQVNISSAEKWVSIFHYWLLKLSLYGIVGEVHSFKETDYDIHYVCMYIHTYIYIYEIIYYIHDIDIIYIIYLIYDIIHIYYIYIYLYICICI